MTEDSSQTADQRGFRGVLQQTMWTEIRRSVLTGQKSKLAIYREYESPWKTLQKILTHEEPYEFHCCRHQWRPSWFPHSRVQRLARFFNTIKPLMAVDIHHRRSIVQFQGEIDVAWINRLGSSAKVPVYRHCSERREPEGLQTPKSGTALCGQYSTRLHFSIAAQPRQRFVVPDKELAGRSVWPHP